MALLAGCGGRAYVYDTFDVAQSRARAEIQVDGPIQVSAAVPGREEAKSIFGIDLYKQGIQPVWLEIQNSGSTQARYALVSTDSNYFSPLEVAYKNRGGLSDEARREMERRFNSLAMPRYFDPGDTRSGFVFTHADKGAKGFNVDVFTSGESYHFTFLLRVPGFVPDYANIDFDSIYAEEEIKRVDADSLYQELKALPCCSTGGNGADTEATLNVVLIGKGVDLLRALLRSRWVETSAAESADRQPDFLFGRQQDAIFRYESGADSSIYELRLWLAPVRFEEQRVWMGQARHQFAWGAFRRFDPDVDNARNFTLQNLIYGQALRRVAWISGDAVSPVESFWANLIRPPFFTDGYRAVLLISGEPIAGVNIDTHDWDDPPGLE